MLYNSGKIFKRRSRCKNSVIYMPVVNVGTASIIFRALKYSFVKYGLDFSITVAFMIDQLQ